MLDPEGLVKYYTKVVVAVTALIVLAVLFVTFVVGFVIFKAL